MTVPERCGRRRPAAWLFLVAVVVDALGALFLLYRLTFGGDSRDDDTANGPAPLEATFPSDVTGTCDIGPSCAIALYSGPAETGPLPRGPGG